MITYQEKHDMDERVHKKVNTLLIRLLFSSGNSLVARKYDLRYRLNPLS
jgi:hypothetical protein